MRQSDHACASSNRFSSDFSQLDIRFLTDQMVRNNPNRNLSSRLGETSQSMSTSSNIESSVIQNTNNCTNATNTVGCCVVGQNRIRAEDLPERVSKLNRTNMNDAQTQATQQHEYVNALRTTRDTVYGEYEQARVGNDRIHSTATATIVPTRMNMTRTETTTSGMREARETQTTTAAAAAACLATNGSSLVNIGSSQALFSRDRLFHASVSSTAHAFFDLFKFSRNSESNIRNFSRSNRENISQNKSCAVAAMRLNVPNQDSTAVAAREPSISVSTRINHIDNSKTVVNISNAHDGCSLQSSFGTMTTLTTTTSSSSSSVSCPSASHIFENGTLLGAIVSQAQPSLKIQVNQNEHHHQSQQTQVIPHLGHCLISLCILCAMYVPCVVIFKVFVFILWFSIVISVSHGMKCHRISHQSNIYMRSFLFLSLSL